MIKMLIVDSGTLESVRTTGESETIDGTQVSFGNDIWTLVNKDRYIKFTTGAYARMKCINIPIELGEEGLLFYHPDRGVIFHNWSD